MYRCQICRDVVGPRQPLLKYVVYRANGQVEQEIPVCPECLDDLQAGVKLSIMLEEHQPKVLKTSSYVVPVARGIGPAGNGKK